MREILNRFAAACAEPCEATARRKRATGTKVIGCLPMYAPEEFIHAAGMLPVIIMAGREPITLADKHLQANACELVRSTYEMGLRGKLDFLDGLVVPDICDQLRFIYGIWKLDHPYPFMHVLPLPHQQGDGSLEYEIQVLSRFQKALEELNGAKITSGALKQSIHVYNQNRSRLRRLYELRRRRPGLLRAREVLDVVVSAMLLPKEEHSQWLEEILSSLESAPTPPQDPDEVGLFIAGQPCDPPEPALLDAIEEIGGVIVDDDMYAGFRYFATDVASDNDPLWAIARHYLNLIPCATLYRREPLLHPDATGHGSYGQFIIERARRSGAEGVVIMLPLYCDPYGFESVPLSDELTEAGIPHIIIETEAETGSLGQLQTKLQAFIEMVRERKLG